MVVAGAVTCALLLREARAEFDGAMMGLGSRAMRLPGTSLTEARTLQINGVDVLFQTQVVDASLAHVLRHYRGVCGTARGGLGNAGALIASLATRSRITDRDGYVACVETGVSDLETLAERLAKFSKTWDLADVGPLRYAYAMRAIDGSEARTFLLTMWSDASIDLRGFIPFDTADAMGTDPVDLPRPPSSQRILSANEVSAPSGVYVYRAQAASAAEFVRSYRRALLERGWAILERNPQESIQVDGVRALSADKGGRTLSVLVHADTSLATVVTLLVSEVD
jgi:hypothetical protein